MNEFTSKVSYGLICCACKREQRIVAPDEGGGITIPEARYIGWVAVHTDEGAHWLCPFCAEGKQTCLSRSEQRFWKKLYFAYFKHDLSPIGLHTIEDARKAAKFASEGVKWYRKCVATGIAESEEE